MIKIIIDCFGGDHSPEANVDGALAAMAQLPDLHLILTGDETTLQNCLKGKSYDASRLEIVHAPEVIGCEERPIDVIRLKKESSMIKAVRMLRDQDDINAMVSIGSTGALVAAALTRIGRVKGVIRPAFCPRLPTMNGGIVGICDSGANVEVTPEHLRQFAIMSSLYMEKVYNIEKPRIALLNVGKEAEKGDEIRQKAHFLLNETPEIHFVGNMESRDLLSGNYDVDSRPIYKLGALLMKRMFMEEKEFMNYQNYGGSVLLGTSKTVVKGHGSSKATAVEKCIEQAYKMEVSSLSSKMEEIIMRYEHYEY